MKPFLTLDESSIDTSLPAANRDDYYIREAARAVVRDNDGAIALLHVTKDAYYKLPGGGIKSDEDPLQALERELLEEIGCRAPVIQNIGTTLEQRYYQKMTQVSHCYIAELVGEKGLPDFTDKELADGFEIVWAKDINEAITLLQSSEATATGDTVNITFMRQRDTAIAKRAQTMFA